MIKYIKKLIKKQKLLNKYRKTDKNLSDHIWLLTKFRWNDDEKHWFHHEYNCEVRCYNRLKKL